LLEFRCRDLDTDDPIGTPFVIYAAMRSEFRDAQEPWTLDVGLALLRPLAGDERHQRQAREVVTRQETLGRKIAVGVELGTDGFAASEQ
jgi:hypothetical protein